jgi:hypothetical protein
MSSPTRTRVRSIVRAVAMNGALFCAAILFALGLSEVLVRIVAPQQLVLLRPDMWQPADTIGWLARAGVRTTVNTGERKVDFITDQEGFRVGSAGRVTAATEILLLGDSFVEALQVQYEQSFAGLMERHAPESVGAPVAVRNAAVGGWSPSQYLIRARQLLARHHYDALVVSVFTGNDILGGRRDYVAPRAPEERATFRLPSGLSKRELTATFAQPLNDFLEVHSQLFVFVRTKLHWLAVRANLSHAYFPTIMYRRELKTDRFEVTTDVLADLDKLGRKQGVPVLFVLIPSDVQVQRDKLNGYVAALKIDPATIDADQPNTVLYERLVGRGVNVVDAMPGLRAAASRGEHLYGEVDPHLTAAGHRVLWSVVQPRLSEILKGNHSTALK